MIRKLAIGIAVLVGLAVVVIGVWMVAIGPTSVVRVLTNGTTTVWDHLRYPARTVASSSRPQPWETNLTDLSQLPVTLDDEVVRLEEVLGTTASLSFLVIDDGKLIYEWYADGHGPETTVMNFSITKTVLGMMIGAAIDDGLIGSVIDPVTDYLPEMTTGGLDQVNIEQLLIMGSSLDYVEDDNPFGRHVEFNYTPDLEEQTLRLEVRSQPDPTFIYKSGDFAVLGLILHRVLGEQSVAGYLEQRFWEPMGATHEAVWSTDHADGLERVWCCLATTARDLARLGQVISSNGMWGDSRILSEEWLANTLTPAYPPNQWPTDYQGSVFRNYGYGIWQMSGGAWAGQGKGGQYLYVQPERDIVVVRQGENTGNISWGSVISQIVDSRP